MLIDDDEVSSYIFSKLITISNFAKHIQSYENAEAALDYLRENAKRPDHLPEVIFLDLLLFDMDGWEFLEQYEKLDESVRDRIHLVILTTSIFENDKLKADKFTSVKKFIQKPITTDNLMEILDDLKKKLTLKILEN